MNHQLYFYKSVMIPVVCDCYRFMIVIFVICIKLLIIHHYKIDMYVII